MKKNISEAVVCLFTLDQPIKSNTKKQHHLDPGLRQGAFFMCIIKKVG